MFVSPFLGKFMKGENRYCWIPALELLEAGDLKLNENESNISPFKTVCNEQMKIVNMSASAIGSSCECS